MRKTYKRQGGTKEMTSTSRTNKFDVLNMSEHGLEVEEVNAVDVVQEIVDITVESGADKGHEDGEADGS